ncbi:MAG: LacI family DNA-binding transcriptional regulator [Lachnospiraceae bacterium]|nr:LacI family DNA-binding transcriptional regulator [Lachnospiraceae bacterium]
MASIKEVAKLAGVGVGTVSRALNGTGYVAEDTKGRILAAARELDYKPNELARNLFRNRTGIIGIVVPDMENPFFSKLLKHMEIELYKNGYKALICNTIEISNREQDFIDMLKQNVMDGIITGAHSLRNDAYLNLNKPVVAMDRDLGPTIPLIHSDHAKGGRLAAELLLEAGCKNVLQFGGDFRVQTPSNNRHTEFIRVMEEAGVTVRTVEMAWNMVEYDYYRRLMIQYMDIYRNVDGVFTTDVGALYCLNIAMQRGIRVPEELHIVGYDGVDMTRLFTPELTTITQDIPALARCCVDTMMDLLDGKPVEMEQILDVSIQRGGTV